MIRKDKCESACAGCLLFAKGREHTDECKGCDLYVEGLLNYTIPGKARGSIVKVVDLVSLVDIFPKTVGRQVWREVANSRHGNQEFCNDTHFIYVLDSINGDDLPPIQQVIKDACKGFMQDEDTIIFDVSW